MKFYPVEDMISREKKKKPAEKMLMWGILIIFILKLVRRWVCPLQQCWQYDEPVKPVSIPIIDKAAK